MQKIKYLLIALLFAIGLSSCLDVNDVDYTDWQKENQTYYTLRVDSAQNGLIPFTFLSPDWAPSASVLVKWHNDRALTAKNLTPLSNSTVDVKYALETIDGKKIQDSYSSTTYGDSIYRSKVSANIIGFQVALTNMHVGDSVTMIIPSSAAYGKESSGSIKPYSTLIYHVKLVKIPAFEIPS